ncbi:hypothetical protein P154DRAFT_605488 [Amniculicola lignicola CBS 123094]|uniref:Cytochrome P450 n=1 Tax=Amniculicola lignicola CBS 123094 TaxID=1392246 RepID=A0A6A5W8U4_9PLEO|nr:hypothetical protein P154DRAFT_605488 [Amniculicola lignicola CBS 123094]
MENLLAQWLATFSHWRFETVLAAIFAYMISRYIYLSYFHPASKYPGPRLASISNLWLSYYRFTGKYLWAVENALRRYGDVVRIAPNELVFVTPQAESGRVHQDGSDMNPQRVSDILGSLNIYTSHTRNQGHFRKAESGIPTRLWHFFRERSGEALAVSQKAFGSMEREVYESHGADHAFTHQLFHTEIERRGE